MAGMDREMKAPRHVQIAAIPAPIKGAIKKAAFPPMIWKPKAFPLISGLTEAASKGGTAGW